MPEDRAGQNYGPCDLFGHHLSFDAHTSIPELSQHPRCLLSAFLGDIASHLIAPNTSRGRLSNRMVFAVSVDEVHFASSVHYVFHVRCPFLSWGIFKHYFVI